MQERTRGRKQQQQQQQQLSNILSSFRFVFLTSGVHSFLLLLRNNFDEGC